MILPGVVGCRKSFNSTAYKDQMFPCRLNTTFCRGSLYLKGVYMEEFLKSKGFKVTAIILGIIIVALISNPMVPRLPPL
jgi:hypothetical protein